MSGDDVTEDAPAGSEPAVDPAQYPRNAPTLPEARDRRPSALNLGPVRSPRLAPGAGAVPIRIQPDKPSAIRLNVVPVERAAFEPSQPPPAQVRSRRLFFFTAILVAAASALALVVFWRLQPDDPNIAPAPSAVSRSAAPKPEAATLQPPPKPLVVPAMELPALDTAPVSPPPKPSPAPASATRKRPQSLREVPDELPY
jgi:hypothetical protein